MSYFSNLDVRLGEEGLAPGTVAYNTRALELQAEDCLAADNVFIKTDEGDEPWTCANCVAEGTAVDGCPYSRLQAGPDDMPAEVQAKIDEAEEWLEKYRESVEELGL